jgi:hypothetical protein
MTRIQEIADNMRKFIFYSQHGSIEDYYFTIDAPNPNKAYSKAHATYGPQVEDMIYCEISESELKRINSIE